MNAVVAPRASTEVATVTDSAGLIGAIARAASDPSVDVAKMERLFAMHQAMVADDARRQFVSAMNEFKQAAPEIIKGKHVKFGQTEYKHATLAMVVGPVTDGLSRHGISHRWATEQRDGKIVVTCILTHRAGHSESTTLESAADQSGGKNAIQAIGSAVTYLQRYTLLAACGLATEDDDGRSASRHEATITDQQAADLQALIEEKGRDLAKFKRWAKVEHLTDILAKNYQACLDAVRSR